MRQVNPILLGLFLHPNLYGKKVFVSSYVNFLRRPCRTKIFDWRCWFDSKFLS